MLKTLVKKLFVLTALSISSIAIAQTDISLGYPGHGGTGCPQGTVSATLSPDAKQLSLIFDSFVTEAGPQTGKTLDRKNCQIAIPVHIPQGFSVSIIDVAYRGFVALPNRQAQARLTAEYFINSLRGPMFVRDFRGAQDTDYIIENTLGVQAQVWSPCGADVNLRASVSMMLRNNSYEDAMATVDSADVSAGIVYQLQWKRCY